MYIKRSLRVYQHHLQSIPKAINLLNAAEDTGKDALAYGLLTMGTVEVLKKIWLYIALGAIRVGLLAYQ